MRRTDSLRNGTLNGLGVAAAATLAFVESCQRYEHPEESGPCTAAALSGGMIWMPIGALIGRAIDRVVGNQEVYRRPRRPNP